MAVKEKELEHLKFYIERIKPYEPDISTFFHGSFFHYTSIYALEQIIRKNTIRLTRSDFLNDRNELFHSINLMKQIYKSNHWKNLNSTLFGKIMKSINRFIDNSFILSLSHNPDSLALWGIYSDFQGYNFKINLKKFYHEQIFNEFVYIKTNSLLKPERIIQRKDDKCFFFTGNVIYDTKKQEKTLYELMLVLDDLFEYMNESSLDHYVTTIMWCIGNNVLLYKNSGFSQEEEYRIILNIRGKSSNFIKYRAQNGVFIPYIEIGCKNKLPLESIGIGPKNNMDIADKGLKMFLSSEGYKVGNKENYISIDHSSIPLRY